MTITSWYLFIVLVFQSYIGNKLHIPHNKLVVHYVILSTIDKGAVCDRIR